MCDEKPGSCSDEHERGVWLVCEALWGTWGGEAMALRELRLEKQKVIELKGSCCWILARPMVRLEAAVPVFMYKPVFGQH